MERQKSPARGHRSARQAKPRALPRLEELESRLVPYALSGDAWPNPQLITISFIPDGTTIGANSQGYISSNLFATWNNRFGSTSAWQNQILKAAQLWAQQTNINFAVVSDDGSALGSGNYQQGASNFGDIRIGGYNFGSGNTTLATADMPPPDNNYSIAGDITFNTGQTFNINNTYDLATVAAHEFGHSLGLGHSATSSATMWGYYNRAKSSLASDDVSGIRAIYSSGNARSVDQYDSGGGDNSFSTAASLTSLLDPTKLSAAVNDLNIASTSDVAYYTVTAPTATSSTFTVTAQSSGLSLLAPTLTVYASDQSTVLGSANGSGQYGTTLSVSVSGVTAGQQFYVKVAGADTTAFGTGDYALTLNFGTGTTPAITIPNTQTLNGTTLHAGGGMAEATGNARVDDDFSGTTGPGDTTGSAPAAAATQPVVLSVLPTRPLPVPGMTLVAGPATENPVGSNTVQAPVVATAARSVPVFPVAVTGTSHAFYPGAGVQERAGTPSAFRTFASILNQPALFPVEAPGGATDSHANTVDRQEIEFDEKSDLPDVVPSVPARTLPATELPVLSFEACDVCFTDRGWMDAQASAREATHGGGKGSATASAPLLAMAGLAMGLAGQQYQGEKERRGQRA